MVATNKKATRRVARENLGPAEKTWSMAPVVPQRAHDCRAPSGKRNGKRARAAACRENRIAWEFSRGNPSIGPVDAGRASPKCRSMKTIAAVVVVATSFALNSITLAQVDRVTGRSFATRSEVIAQHGMVCTSHPLATQIGLDVLKAGGSAVDAAIAANAALGLMEPTGNGIGGDLFAIVYEAKTKKLHGYNGSGRSPKSLTLKHFQDLGLTDIPPLGPLPVSVPEIGRAHV